MVTGEAVCSPHECLQAPGLGAALREEVGGSQGPAPQHGQSLGRGGGLPLEASDVKVLPGYVTPPAVAEVLDGCFSPSMPELESNSSATAQSDLCERQDKLQEVAAQLLHSLKVQEEAVASMGKQLHAASTPSWASQTLDLAEEEGNSTPLLGTRTPPVGGGSKVKQTRRKQRKQAAHSNVAN